LQELSQQLAAEKSIVSTSSGQRSNMPDWQRKLMGLKDTLFGSDVNDLLLAIDAEVKAINQAIMNASAAVSGFKSRYGAAISKKVENAKKEQEIPSDLLGAPSLTV